MPTLVKSLGATLPKNGATYVNPNPEYFDRPWRGAEIKAKRLTPHYVLEAREPAVFQEVQTHPSQTPENHTHVLGGREAGLSGTTNCKLASSLLCGEERANVTEFYNRESVFWDISSNRVPQMSVQLASWQDSWEEPKVAFAELRV